MYPEFIAIFVGLGILTLIMIIVLILLFIILKEVKASKSGSMVYSNVKSSNLNDTVSNNVGIVYCKNCMNPYPADKNVCPHCQTPR